MKWQYPIRASHEWRDLSLGGIAQPRALSLFPFFALSVVRAAITATPTPLPSSALISVIGSSFLFSGQSSISPSAAAHRALNFGYLFTTLPSAATWPLLIFFFVQIAAGPHAVRRALRTAMASARRLVRTNSCSLGVMFNTSRNFDVTEDGRIYRV